MAKYDQLLAYVAMFFFQSLFYIVGFLTVYWIVTLNYFCLSMWALLIILQSFITKGWDKYANFLTNNMKIHEFFPSTRRYEEPVPEEEKTMFAMHPHSVFTYGMHSNLHNPQFPNEKLSRMITLGSRFILSMPLVGAHFKFWGMQSVDPKNLKRLMSKGKTIGIIPGGYEEATLTTPKQMRFFINNRKGFIKYALKYGYTIRPTILLKQHQNLCTFDGLKKLRLFMNKFKIPATIFWGSHGLFYPPFRQHMTVVGKGLRTDKKYAENQDPTVEEIDEMHQRYVQAIQSLYERNKQDNNGVPLKIY